MRIKIDFDSWERNGIVDSGVLIPPSGVVARSLFVQNGEVIYFSYPQALSIERKILIPNGWRLPTIPELFCFSEHIIRKSGSNDQTGRDLELYFRNRSRRCPEIARVNLDRMYWSSDKDLTNGIAHAFTVYDWTNWLESASDGPKTPRNSFIRNDAAIRARIIAVKDV